MPKCSASTSGKTRPMLELAGINAGYGRAQVLFDLDLQVRPGEVVALLGRNGAGKSTTMKVAMGLLRPTSGEIRFNEVNITGKDPFQAARLGLGYVPENRRIFTGLTVRENLEVGRQPPRAGIPAWTPGRLFELFPNLGRMRDRPGGRMSGGEQQMLTVARTLMGNPSTVLLDEPFEGLAPLIVDGMAHAIRDLKREGLAVLLCEQNPRYTNPLADRSCTIERGRVIP
jgi:branched-chain amino acid transport system ATP-binding protein